MIIEILGACYFQNTQLAGYVGNANDALAFPSESTAYTKCTQGKYYRHIFKYLDEIKYHIYINYIFLFNIAPSIHYIESTCGGITYEPASKMWTLRTAIAGTASTSGEISALKLCLDQDIAAGVGSNLRIVLIFITIIY